MRSLSWPLQKCAPACGAELSSWTEVAGTGRSFALAFLAKETARRWLSFHTTKSVPLLLRRSCMGLRALWSSVALTSPNERGVAAGWRGGRRQRGISRSERAQPEMDTLGAHERGHGRQVENIYTPVNTESPASLAGSEGPQCFIARGPLTLPICETNGRRRRKKKKKKRIKAVHPGVVTLEGLPYERAATVTAVRCAANACRN